MGSRGNNALINNSQNVDHVNKAFKIEFKEIKTDDSNVVGQKEGNRIENMLYLTLYGSLKGVEPLAGILFFGPGTGKTDAIKAIVMKMKVHFKHIKGQDIIKDSIEQAGLDLREAFEDLKNNTPSILFIDEIDAISSVATLNNILIVQMEGVRGRPQTTVIAASSNIETLDPVLLKFGLFDRRVEFNVPNESERSILTSQYRRQLQAPVEATDGISRSLKQLQVTLNYYPGHIYFLTTFGVINIILGVVLILNRKNR